MYKIFPLFHLSFSVLFIPRKPKEKISKENIILMNNSREEFEEYTIRTLAHTRKIQFSWMGWVIIYVYTRTRHNNYSININN